MKIWYDTEFLEDGRTIELISIGMVAEDGREYYAVSDAVDRDDKLHRNIRQNRWLMQNVVPHLPLGRNGISPSSWGDAPHFHLDPRSVLVKPRYLIANEIREFILTTPDPLLWAWYAAYDHVALCQLWGRMIDLPEGIPMWTNDLKQECVRLGDPKVPEQDGTEHNALDDARHCRTIHEFLEQQAVTR